MLGERQACGIRASRGKYLVVTGIPDGIELPWDLENDAMCSHLVIVNGKIVKDRNGVTNAFRKGAK